MAQSGSTDPQPGGKTDPVTAEAPPGPAAAGCLASLQLLAALRERGLRQLVVCPGSRSGPLAVAASLLEPARLALHTAVDERSAAFFALGLARGGDQLVGVVTTSGTAVANLLPALVEADQGTIPLLLLTADRPRRLKGCGANQTVNQEAFLRPCCRWVGEGAPEGLASMAPASLDALAARAVAAAIGEGGAPAGPVHLNLPLEEPLHPDAEALAWLRGWLSAAAGRGDASPLPQPLAPRSEVGLDPDQPGVVVAGPWRGRARDWEAHLQALRSWQRRSGWPVLADALSGLRGALDGPLVAGYDLLLERAEGVAAAGLHAPQVLRLGPLPASRRLQTWLERQRGPQVLVSEGDPRPLDPLRCIRGQWSGGLACWPGLSLARPGAPSPASRALCARWLRAEERLQRQLPAWLEGEGIRDGCACADGAGLDGADGAGAIAEPWLVRRLGQLLPPGLAVMLANSSPVRDWETFADPSAPARPLFAFRGASGIDGTLSIACGLAEAVGQLVLVSGDLALLHDSNGWLWSSRLRGRLLVVLIDNGGGGIFEQLPIRPVVDADVDFERLFAMPQRVDHLALAAAHGVPGREVGQAGALAEALAWGVGQPLALLRVVSDRRADAARRRQLRTMAAAMIQLP
jgi:2-succinyl-5-enolpyruvyl-6-hydroxy-3-cyclohexene-1-carboxylate synthase